MTYGRRGAGCQRKKRREARLDYVEDTLESQGQGIKTLEKIFLRQEDRRTKRMGREERLSEPTARTRRRREESPRETHEEKAPSTERPRGSRCAAPEQEAQARTGIALVGLLSVVVGGISPAIAQKERKEGKEDGIQRQGAVLFAVVPNLAQCRPRRS